MHSEKDLTMLAHNMVSNLTKLLQPVSTKERKPSHTRSLTHLVDGVGGWERFSFEN